jgi:RNA exonuclease 1
VLFVPGLTLDMFDGSLNLNPESSEDENQAPASDPKDYFPTNLNRLKLPPCVQAMAEMFPCVWPVKAAGDDRQKRLHSPIKSFLTSPLPKSADPTTIPGSGKRLKVTELLLSLDELVENEYPLHSSQMLVRRKINGFDDLDEEEQTQLKIRDVEGWVETDLSKGNGMENNEAGSILDGKTVYTLDCEMCRTAKDLELTRISMINWDGEVVYDMLVKPPNPITDYLTP